MGSPTLAIANTGQRRETFSNVGAGHALLEARMPEGERPDASEGVPLEEQELEELLSFARDITRRAGALVMDYFRKPHEVEYKGNDRRNPVTEADQASEAYLVSAIEERYPHHAILAEESPDRSLKDSLFLWVLDPLDGTTNFLNGMPLFAVSVGLLYQGRPIAGCLFLPYPGREEGSLFSARLGGGAFQDGEPVFVASGPLPGGGHIALLPGRYSRFLSFKGAMETNHGEVRALGSICYEAALVTRGVAQYVLLTGPRAWDVAAAALLVQEAGGLVLVGTGLKRWEPFEAFPYPYGGKDGKGVQLRRWGRPMVIGNAVVASYVAARVRRRSFPWLRLRRWLRQRMRRGTPQR